MQFRGLILLCSLTAIAVGVDAQAITGTILIKRKLTRPSVTPSVSVYQRGSVVELGKSPEQDPIAYERSRVAIYLDGPAPGTAKPEAPEIAQIQQLNRRFAPDILVLPVGSTVVFPNMDPIFHNIYSLSKPKSFDLGSYDKGQTRSVTFSKTGIVDIYCHLHPNMQATVVVTPNRWYTKADRNGQYRIPDVPAGQYTVVAWHKSAGFFRKVVVVGSDRDSAVDFFIPVDVEVNQANKNVGEPGHHAGSM